MSRTGPKALAELRKRLGRGWTSDILLRRDLVAALVDDATESLKAEEVRGKLYVVIGGWMDYGDRSDVLVGVFDDEARANEVSRDALASTYDVTRLVPVDLNAVRDTEGE